MNEPVDFTEDLRKRLPHTVTVERRNLKPMIEFCLLHFGDHSHDQNREDREWDFLNFTDDGRVYSHSAVFYFKSEADACLFKLFSGNETL